MPKNKKHLAGAYSNEINKVLYNIDLCSLISRIPRVHIQRNDILSSTSFFVLLSFNCAPLFIFIFQLNLTVS